MKRQYIARRRGAVLLLILGLMAMFAISILTYMVVTSNMAETAQNSAKLDSVVEIPAQEDVDAALKNVVLGSNNERNPIGPFGILENMYGDWKEYDSAMATEDSATEFLACVNIFPNKGCAVVVPVWDTFGNDLETGDEFAARTAVSSLFENSGGVLTFKSWDGDDTDFWRADVEGTSAFVLEKVITNPSNLNYVGNNGDFWDKYYNDGILAYNNKSNFARCDRWHFKVELTDDLKRFVDDYCGVDNVNTRFNENGPTVWVRLNRPAYSGTGAGGFTPGETKDATVPSEMVSNDDAIAFANSNYLPSPNSLRLPFAFWANASAPDMRPFQRVAGAKFDFRAFWAHLIDVNYDANQYDVDNPGFLRYVAENGNAWTSYNGVMNGFANGAWLEPVRMNPAYTAPDNRSVFLAHYDGPMSVNGDLPGITPSFHRPTLFKTLVDNSQGFSYLGLYRGLFSAGGVRADASDLWMTSIIRKLTPRPLPNDHWNFTGGNDYLANGTGAAGALTPEELATRLGDSAQWDVDNDGDGVREGIWIPSGLPIRVDKNGKAYATMYSYTILDLDGRVNVNTAGNWDQLPNKMYSLDRFDAEGNTYTDNSQPYNYVDEIASIWGTLSDTEVGRPFFAADNLNSSYGWRDDSDQNVDVAVRGDGRGTSDVLLYEALSSVFSDSASTYDVATIASNMLWRRNLSMKDNPTGPVDQSGLVWEDAQMGSQPGALVGGAEVDDSVGTRAAFFRYMDPVRLRANESDTTLSNSDTASLGESKMIYPYRGKTTVGMGNMFYTAVYDFADTAFRSYDPLGAQVYTYAPRYSNNPYLAYQNYLTLQDSPYTLPMLERLLRPWDADANALPAQLVDDLGLNVDLYGANVTEVERAKARGSLTTLSSDVPSPSLVFPENKELEDGEYRGGHFGFVDLIRNCVRQELYKVFKAKDVCATVSDVDADGNPIEVKTNDYLDVVNPDAFNHKVEEITQYLAAMLPPEITAGEKIDLNALAQKDYWLDIDDSDPDNLIAAGDEWQSGNLVRNDDRRLHNYGLVKRMERARGLYIVMMTLLYEDMNANAVYGEEIDEDDAEAKLSDYVEGSFDLLKYNKGDRKKAKGLMAQELTATRIAQWCVNTIDFADPDATMTPFFFDPTPFDGWWIYDNSWIDAKTSGDVYCWSIPFTGGNPEPTLGFLFDPANGGLPSEQMFHFFSDALNDSEVFVEGAQYKDANGTVVDFGANFVPAKTDDEGNITEAEHYVYRRSDENIAAWLSKKIEHIEDQTSDMGFRLCWGMERPDLVLTETLSFHDLGIADTAFEKDTDADVGKVSDGLDDSFDQVRRPEGSTYLELYCTANPNVPQSRELYDYDATEGLWKLRLSKKTPIYKDSLGRELEMPVWRVAISASADARRLNVKKSTEGITDPEERTKIEQANNELESGNKLVYNKRRNSVLEWLSPNKFGDDDDDYGDDVSFFSMQPRQFRNYPMPAGHHKIDNIADYDIIQKVKGPGDRTVEIDDAKILKDWKAFNISSFNILGAAVAETDDVYPTKEVELDRIVWFTHAQGDSDNEGGKELGTAGEYPDALRTFANADAATVYLAPNQYLVVGPEQDRAIGSVAYNSATEVSGSKHFGEKAGLAANHINLSNLGVTGFNPNAQYMVAKANIGGRGLNISEPLWNGADASMDPYRLVTGDATIRTVDPALKPGGESGTSGDATTYAVMDIPFELPKDWSEGDRSDVSENFYKNTVSNYPIVQDGLFGLGTVPAYKTAFVQRVADPNRPYHPLMNPYITVDWNMMDLTIINGECVQISGGDSENSRPFTKKTSYPFGTNNEIKLAANTALNLEKDKTLAYKDAFSSRQWGNSGQKAFAPGLDGGHDPSIRPNPWARAFKGDGDKAGLQASTKTPDAEISALGTNKVPVIQNLPKHTLGMYNDMGERGTWAQNAEGNWEFTASETGLFKNLNSEYLTQASSNVYWGAPRVPFEHLVWNDAPFSNPMELALVPASAPGRFGLEFVRSEGDFNLAKLYNVDKDKKSSLGSFGVFGFKDWYNDNNIKKPDAGGGGPADDDEWKKLKGKANVTGPYLNFFASSKKPGETLNLCKALEFVYVPSLFLGTKTLANSKGNIVREPVLDASNNVLGYNPVLISKRREPGKININTATKPAWQAISPNSERIQVGDRLPGTPWDDFQGRRSPFASYPVDTDGDGEYDSSDSVDKDFFTYFQPSHTLGLWVQLDGSKAPVPTYASLLAQQDCDLSESGSSEDDPLFDNIAPASYDTGERMYEYVWYDDPDNPTPETRHVDYTNDPDSLPAGTEWHELKYPRNNLYEATAEMQRLSGLTTTRSNVFAVWVTVGYFEVERCNPGVNMPKYDPDGNSITLANLTDSTYKWYQYFQAIYPDGFTYGKELGSEFGESKRHRGFSIIDRSIPVDFRRGNSSNYKNSILLQRIID